MNLIIILLIILIILFLYFKNKNIENFDNVNNYSYNDVKPVLKHLYDKKSDYYNIKISENDKFGKCLIIDNEIQLCDKKEIIYHEMIVDFPMKYLNKDPEYVLIIGGGDLMTLREVMKYKSIKKVFMLELNPSIVKVCKKHFGVSDYKKDKRVKIIYGDAYFTIDEISDYKFDLIIHDTTEDNNNNLKIDKKYFFNKCYKLLNNNGIMVKNGEHFQNYFNQIYNNNTISYSTYIPYFQSTYFFVITGKKDLLNSKLRNYNIKYKYYNPNKHYKYVDYYDFKEINNY